MIYYSYSWNTQFVTRLCEIVFKDDEVICADITNHSRDISSRKFNLVTLWHEEKARERNVDTLNKPHYELENLVGDRVTRVATNSDDDKRNFGLTFFSLSLPITRLDFHVRVIAFQ